MSELESEEFEEEAEVSEVPSAPESGEVWVVSEEVFEVSAVSEVPAEESSPGTAATGTEKVKTERKRLAKIEPRSKIFAQGDFLSRPNTVKTQKIFNVTIIAY